MYTFFALLWNNGSDLFHYKWISIKSSNGRKRSEVVRSNEAFQFFVWALAASRHRKFRKRMTTRAP